MKSPLLVFLFILFGLTNSPAQDVMWSNNLNDDALIVDGLGSGDLGMLLTSDESIVAVGWFNGDNKFLRYDTSGRLLNVIDSFFDCNSTCYDPIIYMHEKIDGRLGMISSSGLIISSDNDGEGASIIDRIMIDPNEVIDRFRLIGIHDDVIYLSGYDYRYEVDANSYGVIESYFIDRDHMDNLSIVVVEFMSDDSFFELYNHRTDDKALLQYYNNSDSLIWEQFFDCEEGIADLFVTDKDEVLLSCNKLIPGITGVTSVISLIDKDGNQIWRTSAKFSNNIEVVDDYIYLYGGFHSAFGSAGAVSKLDIDGDLIWESTGLMGFVKQLKILKDHPIVIAESGDDSSPIFSYLTRMGKNTTSIIDPSDNDIAFSQSDNYLYIDSQQPIEKVIVFDTSGRMVLKGIETEIFIGNFPAGMYFLNADGVVHSFFKR